MTDSAAARVRVLGPVDVDNVQGRPASLGGVNARALVASLAVHAPGAVSVDALTDDVWGDAPPHNPRASLQTLVSRIRAAAGAEIVRSVPGGYALGGVASDLDLVRGALEGHTDASAHADRLAALTAAAECWRGPVGADLGTAPIREALVEASDLLFDRAQRALADALCEAGRVGDAVPILRRQAEVHPFDETLQAALMSALAEDGRTGEALALFSQLRASLRESLGTQPGAALTALNARLLQSEAPAPAHVRIGLQAAPNELIGRADDVAALADALARARLVTVLGPGGLGKTRIAQAVAAASELPLVAFVPLAGVRDDEDVPLAIAAALGISEAGAGGRLTDVAARPDLRARVIAMLEASTSLIVLDNCEQVIEGVARWAADVLAAAGTVCILATSRSPLAVAGEVVFPLDALSVDPGAGGGAAVRLFRERARAVRPTVALPDAAVARVCAHLDGLPLAIELAAARVRTMSVEQIEQGLQDRFALLVGRDRTAPERHRTLHAVIGWSWDLLGPAAAMALSALAVLPAGFTLDTARAMVGAQADDAVEQLVSQSLLVAGEEQPTPGLRFRMLETVREYALERLDDEGEGRDASWRRAREWAHAFCRDRVTHAFAVNVHHELRGEHDNLVGVLRRTVDDSSAARARGDEEDACAADVDTVVIFAALVQMWMVRGAFSEVEAFIVDAVAATERAHDEIPADALAFVLSLGVLLGRFSPVSSAARIAVRLRCLRREGAPPDPVIAAVADLVLAADMPAAHARIDQLRHDANPRLRLVGESALANLAENDGRLDEGLAAAERAWDLAQHTGDVWAGAMAASSAAQLSSQLARPSAALRWLDRGQEAFSSFAVEEQMHQHEWLRAMNLIFDGDRAAAREIFVDLREVREATDEGLELAAIGEFGIAEIDRLDGETASAAARYRRAIERFGRAGGRNSPWYLMVLAGAVAAMSSDGSAPDDELRGLARRLRTRSVALQRVRPEFTDRPVLGTVLAGWSAWAVTSPDPQTRSRGLEALALASRIGGRQDLPSLRHDALRRHAAALLGDDRVARAAAEASALSDDEVRVRTSAALQG